MPSPQPSRPSLTPPVPTPSSSAAGRKRSYDEAVTNLDPEYFPPLAPPGQGNEDEWEYGEGMVLIKPKGAGYIIDAGSQTGTWAEDKAAKEAEAAAAAAAASKAPVERAIIRCAKSQRRDFASTPSIVEEVSHNRTLTTPASATPTTGLAEPTIDDFTRHLGIGWSLISADEGIQAAARGWTKFINNHFPVTSASIRLQSKGLASYLVEANEGFFLFGEDLKQGRLVSTSLEKTWLNLQGPVPLFDGDLVMEAGDSPKVNGGATPLHAANDENMITNGLASDVANHQLANGQTLEVEMDMN